MLGQALSGIPVRNLNQAPQEQSWSFDIQHQLPGSILVDAAYVGRKGTHLYAMGYANQFDALPPNVADAFRANPSYYLAAGSQSFLRSDSRKRRSVRSDHSPLEAVRSLSAIQRRRCGPGISSSFVPWANSIYNAAQLRIEKRFSQGLQFLFTYVFQKSLDDSSLGFERLLVSDRRHRPQPNRMRATRTISGWTGRFRHSAFRKSPSSVSSMSCRSDATGNTARISTAWPTRCWADGK